MVSGVCVRVRVLLCCLCGLLCMFVCVFVGLIRVCVWLVMYCDVGWLAAVCEWLCLCLCVVCCLICVFCL